MFRQYQRAIVDPQVEKIAPPKRMAAIAKDAGFKKPALEQAVAKGEAAGDVKARCEANVKEALGASGLAGKLSRVDVDAESPHAVMYIGWNNAALDKLEEEASLVAAETAKACPFLSTIRVWAQDASNPKTRVFQALISRTAAVRIDAKRVDDFADTRFIRLFEGVKNISAGDDLSQPPADSAGSSGARP